MFFEIVWIDTQEATAYGIVVQEGEMNQMREKGKRLSEKEERMIKFGTSEQRGRYVRKVSLKLMFPN